MKRAAHLSDWRVLLAGGSKSINIKLIFFLTIAYSLSFQIPILAEVKEKKLEAAVNALVDPRLIDSTSICVRDIKRKVDIVTINCDQPLKPASVMKLLTSSAALELLGPEYTWKTLVSINGLSKGNAQSVVIRGVGDPSITTESLWILARRIKKLGIDSIDSIILDNSAFSDQKLRSGVRAYEGGNSALTFNFNSIGFEVCPTSPGNVARVVTDPWEAGQRLKNKVITLNRISEPLTIEDFSTCTDKSCQLEFQATGSIDSDSDCIQLYRSVERPDEYFGRTLQQFLRQLGLKGQLALQFKNNVQPTNLSFEFASKSLREVLVGLNNFSTNVTADQVVYAIGNDVDGYFSFSRGIDKMRSYLRSIEVPEGQYKIFDGSGLSHENRLSGAAIVKLLDTQANNIQTGVELQGALAIWGRTGTLKNRKPLERGVLVRAKTGSLDGVSSLAGYLYSDKGEHFAFSILQNRVASKAKAVDIEDEIIEFISSY